MGILAFKNINNDLQKQTTDELPEFQITATNTTAAAITASLFNFQNTIIGVGGTDNSWTIPTSVFPSSSTNIQLIVDSVVVPVTVATPFTVDELCTALTALGYGTFSNVVSGSNNIITLVPTGTEVFGTLGIYGWTEVV